MGSGCVRLDSTTKNPRKKNPACLGSCVSGASKKKVAQKMNHADHQKGGQPPVRLAPSVHFFSSKNPSIRQPEVEVALAGGRSTRHLLSRISTGTFKCRTITMVAPRPPHASLPPSRAALPPASAACHFLVNGCSTSRLFCAKPAAPTQIDKNEHDGPHVHSESQVVITTDTCQIESRAIGVGWVAWFGFPCYGPALRVERTPKNREAALVLSPRPGHCARLLLANQAHVRSSLAVLVRRRTEMH